MIGRLKRWARIVKRDAHAIYLAANDPRVPWHAKVLAGCVAAYALAPLDLIPDFIPVLGLLDDAIIVPLGILLVIRMIPREIMEEHRIAAAAGRAGPIGKAGAAAVAMLWLSAAVLCGWLAYRYLPAGLSE